VFDPQFACFRTVVLADADVIDLLPLSHAPERVAEYREQMQRGARFPPVSVIRLAGRYLVADGHKRLSAYRQLGHQEILVELWPLRRWLLDQWRQVRSNSRKNLRILSMGVSDPPAAWRLLLTTALHWRRVAISLTRRAAGRLE
jgi:hypothetical protein